MINSYRAYYLSPIGLVEIIADESGILGFYFVDKKKFRKNNVSPLLNDSVRQVDEYFKGQRKSFDIPLNPLGTEFQKKVWKELLYIPFGKTVFYLDISKAIGDGNATRVVGNANGKNPISVLVPCHRVIGVNGTLTGYGGGLWRKKWLLNHERNILYGKQTQLF